MLQSMRLPRTGLNLTTEQQLSQLVRNMLFLYLPKTVVFFSSLGFRVTFIKLHNFKK